MGEQVAKDIISYCTRCKMDLVHLIVAMDGEKIKRVLCKTCNKEHAYRLPKEGKGSPAKKRTTRAARSKKITDPAIEWEKALEVSKDIPAKCYTFDGSFEAGDRVDHGTFGLGLVNKLIQPNKMEVIFKAGTKLMIRGR
jgi:hypothetical protein